MHRISRPLRMGVGLTLLGGLTVVGAGPASVASPGPRFVALDAPAIEARGFTDTALALVADIYDSSYGPTEVSGSSRSDSAEVAPKARSSRESASTTVDVDGRVERTQTAAERAGIIAGSEDLSPGARTQVAGLIEEYRDVEARATEGSSDVDIVSSTVAPLDTQATQDSRTGIVLVETTMHVAQEYRSGVVSEGIETTNVAFDAATGEVLAVNPISLEDIAAATVEPIGVGSGSSSDAPAADERRLSADAAAAAEAPLANRRGFSAPTAPSFATGLSSTGKQKVVDYALKYWDNYNPSYRSFTNDCTNFISQAMRAGGWAMDSGWYRSNSNWWYNSANQTFSWAGAENWYRFARVESGRTSHLNSVYSLRAGDVLQAKWSGNSNMNHSMIVTKYTGGEVYLTYHTSDRKNKSFSWFTAQFSGESYYTHRV